MRSQPLAPRRVVRCQIHDPHCFRTLREGVTKLDTEAKRARDRAEAAFKKKERQLQEGQQAMSEYEAARAATSEKTARLRALRLARDAGLKTPIPATRKQPA